MSDRQDPLAKTRVVALWVGGALLVAYFLVHFHFSDFLQELHRLNPAEEEVRRQADDRLESIFLHFAIPLLVVGAEGALPWLADFFGKRRRDKLFLARPRKPWRSPTRLPALITSDIDACLTPPAREVVVLRSIHKLRQYCQFVQEDSRYPPLILVSARSQEYTELMCQMLGSIDSKRDIPCVLENGMAVYYPHARTVKQPEYVTVEMRLAMDHARFTLESKLKEDYEFESKRYMITVNVERQRHAYGTSLAQRKEAVLELRRKVETTLREANPNFEQVLNVSSTSNAVDVVPRGVNKLKGLECVLEEYRTGYSKDYTLKDVASIGNSEADEPVLEAVGQPFCNSMEAGNTVIAIVLEKCADNVFLTLSNSSAVVAMVEKVTGLNLL